VQNVVPQSSFHTLRSFALSIGVQSSVCKEKNEVSSKIGALLIIKGVLGLPIDIDAIPAQQGRILPDTIIEAESVGVALGNVIESIG